MISVIIPVYNIADYLPKCIESVINQEYTDWELILVNDGSRDASGDVCDSYAVTDSRITVVHTENRGVSNARNTGLEMAEGDWISFIDGDDWVEPDYLKSMIEAAQNCDCDVVVAGWENNNVDKAPPLANLDSNNNFEFFTSKINFGFICAKLYKRSLIESSGVRFSPNVAWSEDALFVYRIVACHSKMVSLIPAVGYHYVSRPGSAAKVSHPFEKEFEGYRSAMDLMQEMVGKYGLRITPYFSPFAFLWRSITAMYAAKMDKAKRFEILKSLDFDRKWMYPHTTHWKENMLATLMINKQWRVLDMLLSRLYR